MVVIELSEIINTTRQVKWAIGDGQGKVIYNSIWTHEWRKGLVRN